MTSFTSKALLSKLRNAKKGNKQNGFTLIELMVVVAIVGVLSAVGLPALTKAQDKAKDSAALATLTNAAKECSLTIITGTQADFQDTTTKIPVNPAFAAVKGDCLANDTLGLASNGSVDGYTIQFDGSVPLAGVVSTTATISNL